MFAKLLKQEWRGCRQVLGILCAIILGSGVTIGLCGVYLNWLEGQTGEKNYTLSIILMFAAFLALGICSAGGFLYLIWRFYQSRFTDEGYLTFTLPVTNHHLLLSAVLNILRGSLAVFLAVLGALFLAALTFLLVYAPTVNWTGLLQAVFHWLPELLDSVYWPDCLLLLASALMGIISSVVTLMLSVTIGSILAKKHHLLMAVAVYYGIGLLQSWGFLMLATQTVVFTGQFIYYPLVTGLVTSLAGYWIMYWLQEKNLNLT